MNDTKEPIQKVDQNQLEKWKQQYGEVYKVISDEDDPQKQLVFYFKKPERQNLSRFIKDSMKDAYKAMATMIEDLALYPSREKRNVLFQEQPGLVVSVGNELTKMTGVSQDFLTSKV